MPARSVCLVTLSLSEAGPGRFGGQVSVTDIYHTIPYQLLHCSFFFCPALSSGGLGASPQDNSYRVGEFWNNRAN